MLVACFLKKGFVCVFVCVCDLNFIYLFFFIIFFSNFILFLNST